ncbi:Ran-binding-domain-containing protein [Ascobolus immersus RN42]|uniref:Ran-binding-domain-containing protein n=1 Tax=Ascobolus immersus RN42 TaxID=1160509 RepID=A0A3N4IEE2_ASCIM|nr:Ran-binding-domain-containing protein [Ascobolus immersus RN42]
MEELLSKVANQSITFAIRSGIGVVSGFAMQKGATYIRTLKGKDKEELRRLHERLEAKIKIITPAIDLVELIAARGNTALESAVSLTKSIRLDIQNMGIRFANAMELRRKPTHEDSKDVERLIKDMLRRLEDAVPLINLALNTSGVELSTGLPEGVSPSRLLQASQFVAQGDKAYVSSGCKQAQIGTTFNVTMYMKFHGYSHRDETLGTGVPTWQEVISKCRLKLERVPLTKYLYGDQLGEAQEVDAMRNHNRAEEYCYELVIIEDLDDGRVHDEDDLKRQGLGGSYEGVKKAGLRARIPIHQIGKLFYTHAGKLLGIDEASSPVLLINRQTKALPPRRLETRIDNAFDYDSTDDEDGEPLEEPVATETIFPEHFDLPRHLDQDWLAFEIYQEPIADDTSDFGLDDDENSLDAYDDPTDPLSPAFSPSASPRNSLSNYNTPNIDASAVSLATHSMPSNAGPSNPDFSNLNVQSHLSLLEMQLRLLNLQTHAQKSHLAVHDEMLNLFLTNQSSAIIEENPVSRDTEREMARQRLGFDPFSSSPIRAGTRKHGPRTPTKTRFPTSPMTARGGTLPPSTPAEADLGLPILEATPPMRRHPPSQPPSQPSSSFRRSSPPIVYREPRTREESRDRQSMQRMNSGGTHSRAESQDRRFAKEQGQERPSVNRYNSDGARSRAESQDRRLADQMSRGISLEEKRRSGHGTRDGYVNIGSGRMTPISPRDSVSSTSTISNRGGPAHRESISSTGSFKRNSGGWKEPTPDDQLRMEAIGRSGR